jgi:hypothetical protein
MSIVNITDHFRGHDRLDDIQVNDEVIIKASGHRGFSYRRAVVEKVTKTQFTTGDQRYIKDGGEQYGSKSNWSRGPQAYRFTQERWEAAQQYMQDIEQQEKRNALRHAVSRQNYLQIPMEQIVQIAEILGIEHDVTLKSEEGN